MELVPREKFLVAFLSKKFQKVVEFRRSRLARLQNSLELGVNSLVYAQRFFGKYSLILKNTYVPASECQNWTSS